MSSTAKLDRALDLANRYAPDRVSNLMTVGGTQQVMLKVRFAEMQRSVAKNLSSSIALGVGGPGAMFWMWIVACVGMATAYVESTLAQLSVPIAIRYWPSWATASNRSLNCGRPRQSPEAVYSTRDSPVNTRVCRQRRHR